MLKIWQMESISLACRRDYRARSGNASTQDKELGEKGPMMMLSRETMKLPLRPRSSLKCLPNQESMNSYSINAWPSKASLSQHSLPSTPAPAWKFRSEIGNFGWREKHRDEDNLHLLFQTHGWRRSLNITLQHCNTYGVHERQLFEDT